MKVFKRIIITLLVAAVLLAAVFALGRYGWKLLGFRACQGAGIESVEVAEGSVEISGFYPGSFPEGFCGYYARQQDGTLYVGFRFSSVFGVFETGNFDVDIPVDGNVSEVILKTKTSENIIWSAESDAPAVPDVPNVPADVTQGITLPILDEIDGITAIGTAGSSMLAVQAAAKLLDWGVNTGLGTDEILDSASAWLAAKGDGREEAVQKLALVDDACQRLYSDEARELLDSAGCADTEITWGSGPVEPVEAVEAVMQAAGLR